MLRSLFSGISGLRAHQQMMDVTGNNIANVNTIGYKSSQAVFQDTLSQMVNAAGAPQNGLGGTNPAQAGLGVRTASISANFTQGAAQTTGKASDMMIQGDGFFVVRSGGEELYTRAGSFSFDANGSLTTPNGQIVQGWSGVNGVVNTADVPGDIKLPIGVTISPTVTANITLTGNFSDEAAVGATQQISVKVYDTKTVYMPADQQKIASAETGKQTQLGKFHDAIRADAALKGWLDANKIDVNRVVAVQNTNGNAEVFLY